MKNLALISSAFVLLGCESPELISNSQFDAWCGDKPCGWEVDGEVARVGTWHPSDYAVDLVSDDARVHQLTPIDRSFGGCIEFSMLAKVGSDVRVFVELDFLDDGSIDWSERLPESDYASLSFSVRAPAWFEGVRVIVRKDGPGLARIARLRADAQYETCVGETVELKDLPSGAPCDEDEACAGKSCTAGACDGCDDDDDCEAGETCGYKALWNGRFGLQCIEPGDGPIGSLCNGNAECQSGICCENVCSTCCTDDDCDPIRVCAPAVVEASEYHLLPHLCNPGVSNTLSGAVCVDDGDCISGDCVRPECGEDECEVMVSGNYCDRYDYSCNDIDDPLCCWFCSPDVCRVFELPVGTCR